MKDEFDALFKLPLAEFIAARNTLSARLKKAGHGAEAERVKALVKPSISAWAVNQLYWRHREAFDRLIEAGEHLRRAHASQLAGKAADMRGPLTERREALSGLTRLGDALLRDSGHSAAPDTIRRITTTLEALSSYASFSDAAVPGRLTGDVDPPGFESMAALIPSGGRAERPTVSSRVIPFQRSAPAAEKAALHAAELTLRECRTKAQEAAELLKKVAAHANEAEKDRREARERFEKASAAAEEASRRLQTATAESEKAAKALEDAEHGVENARKEKLRSER